MKSIFFFFVLMLSIAVNAQYISGKIINQSEERLSGASVYFDGSTIGTLTREDGSFKIKFSQQSNLTLVIRYLGYETFYLPNPNPNSNYEIVMTPEENQLDEVVLDGSVFSRKEMLKAFKRDFLGETKGGKKAKILNEDDIRFYYDKNDKSLFASSRRPIQIINKELGYKVEFDLIDFISEFSLVSLDKNYQRSNYFGGTSFFKNISEENRKIKRKRLKAYEGSSRHFFNSLIHDNLEEENFDVFHKGFQVPHSSIFEVNKIKVKAESSQSNVRDPYVASYEIKILGNDFESLSKKIPLLKNKFQKKLAILYKDDRSDINFKTKVFYVDDYGNHTHIDKILFSGEMSKSRLGGMLPINYQPND